MTDGATRLDRYLTDLHARLRRLPEAEVRDIVQELRGHVRESVGGGGSMEGEQVAAVLRRLGTPEELASHYLTDRMLARAASGWSPWALMAGLMRATTLSAGAGFALAGLLAGYVVAASFLLAALLKPFGGDRVGLWRLAGGELSLRLGFGDPVAGEELLGWWIVPIGLAAGAAALWLAGRLGRWGIVRVRERLLRRAA